MPRPQIATNVKKFAATPPQQRKGNTGGRRPVASDDPQDETAFYSERLAELEADYQKLQRDYQQQLVANRRAIRQLQEENTLLRGIAVGYTLSGDITAMELEQLETRKFIDVRRLNRLTYELEKLQSEVSRAENVNQTRDKGLVAVTADAVTGNNSVALRIQKLEKRLDGLLAEQQSAVVVLDRYKETLEQLTRENASHDQCIISIDRDIDTRSRGYDQLKIMFSNAINDHKSATDELLKFKDTFEKTRHKKEKAVANQRTYIEKMLSETKNLEKREAQLHHDIEDEQQRIADVEVEQQSIRRRRQRKQTVMERLSVARVDGIARSDPLADTTNAFLADSFGAPPEDEERAAAFDELFRDMMTATGAVTLEELVEKCEAEYALRVQMRQQIRAAKQSADEIRDCISRERERRVSRRLNGLSAAPPASRCIRADLHAWVREALEGRERVFEHGIAVQGRLVEVMRRVDLLAHRISDFRSDVVVPHTDAENLVANLRLLSKKALSLADEAVGDVSAGIDAAEGVFVTLTAKNNRVKLPSAGATASLPGTSPGGTTMTSAGGTTVTLCATSLEDECGLLTSPDAGTAGVSPCSSDLDEEAPVPVDARQSALIQSDEPLNREQIKKLAAQVLRREKRRQVNEERK